MAFGIPESIIDEIKTRTDLSDLIAGYGIQVKRVGGSYKACCPFHHEKTPSFHIQPAKGFYHCFGCGESGDVIKFVMKYEGLSFMEAAQKLASACGLEFEAKEDPEAAVRKRLFVLHAELAAFYRRCLKDAKEAALARGYLSSRDLSDEVAEKFQIGYAPQSADAMLTWAKKHGFTADELEAAGVLKPPLYRDGSWYSPFAGRLMFSIRDRQGRVIAFSGRTLETDKAKMRGGKYVNSPATPIFKKSNVLYAFDLAAGKIANAKPVREAIVCEGQIDVVRCHACGFDTAVASQGTAFTDEHVQILKKVADAAVLVFDGDAAGQKATVSTAGEMLSVGMTVRVAQLPAGEDPDSMLRSKGVDAFKACLDNAVSIVAFQVSVARAKESNPDSYDAIARTGRAVLELVRKCPGAVMRAGLMQEAATLLNIPVSALEEDLARLSEERPKFVSAAKKEWTRPKPSETMRPVSEMQRAGASAASEQERIPPIVDECRESVPSEDAAAPENNPPPDSEMVLMEFLYGLGGNAQIADMLESYAPDALFAHYITGTFVRAYVRETRGEVDSILNLRNEIPEAEFGVLEEIFLSQNRAAFSELEPAENLRKTLGRLWFDAVCRRLRSLPTEGDAELMRRRSRLSMLSRKFKTKPWRVACQEMRVDVLAD
ncbi:MAG: DNA primase [Lentisphaerae bacterium]|nr:DNA primase [Lentisphaerota bacterium]